MAAEKKKPPQESKSKEQPEAAETPKAPGRFPLSTVIVVAGVLLMEVATVGLVMWLNHGPRPAAAEPPVPKAESAPAVAVETVEEPICEGKAINTKRGVTYSYRYRIFAVCRERAPRQWRRHLQDPLRLRRGVQSDFGHHRRL